MRKVVITSGYFNPIHIGHINLLREARQTGDFLVVIVNNDEQVTLKSSTRFMNQNERVEIMKSLKYVDEVFLSIDKDESVCESLKFIAKLYKEDNLFFVNGGDRCAENIPEVVVCEKLNISLVDNVGGGKIQSSSWLLSKIKK